MGSFSILHWLIVLLPILLPLILKFGFGIGTKNIEMRNDRTGQIKIGKFGYSWTYLFFGFFVPLFRSELGVAALHLLFSIVTFGLWNLIVSFLYNKQYTNRLLEKGYTFIPGSNLENEAARKLGVDLRYIKKDI
jgi:hypothetical protein